jgi:peptidoglycan/LPS O-acetylase OafA/YrhL
MLAAFFLFVAVLNLRPIQKLLESSLLCYLGKISYSLYAVHFLIMGSVGCMIFVEARIYLDHLTAVIIAFAGSMLVLVPLAHVMHENVDLLFISLAGKFGKYIDSRRWLRDLLREPSVIKSPAVNPVFINSLTINESNITQNKAA